MVQDQGRVTSSGGGSITFVEQLRAPLQMVMDVLGLVGEYDETHPLLMEGHRRKNARRVRKGIANAQSLGASRTRCAPSSRVD